MSQPMKILGAAAALITAALVGGTLIGSVVAAPFWATSTGSGASSGAGTFLELSLLGDESDTGAYCEVFLDTFASELGVGTDELAPAAKAAAIAAIEAAVEAGDLTAEQGDALIERVNNWDGTGCAWIGFHLRHWAGHGVRVEFMEDVVEAAAGELGMTTAELREALVDANLEGVAEAEGVDYADVVAAALASAQADLDAAVEAGQITQEKADQIYARLETWLNDGGPGNWGEGPRDGGRHFRFFFGPPSDAPSNGGSEDGADDSSAEGTAA